MGSGTRTMSHTSTEENRGAMDHPVKVLLANRPRVLRTRLEELLQHQSDVEVVGTALDRVKLLMAVEYGRVGLTCG
jgi:hypothetical protein